MGRLRILPVRGETRTVVRAAVIRSVVGMCRVRCVFCHAHLIDVRLGLGWIELGGKSDGQRKNEKAKSKPLELKKLVAQIETDFR